MKKKKKEKLFISKGMLKVMDNFFSPFKKFAKSKKFKRGY